MFGARKLESSTEVVGDTAQGPILRVTFSGVHQDGVGHVVGDHLCEALERHQPAAVVLDFLHFDYRWGNDIGGICEAFLRKDPDGKAAIRPSAIVATGSTAKSFMSLLQAAKVLDEFGVRCFRDVDSAVEHLRRNWSQRLPNPRVNPTGSAGHAACLCTRRAVNREVIVVKPRKPYVDWANSCDDHPTKTTLDDPHRECTAYLLLPEWYDDDELEQLVLTHSRSMSESELAGRSTDESTWPTRRDYKTFLECLESEDHRVVLELGDGMIEIEET